MELHVSIGRVKRDISELVNRVAYGGERLILTSRGKPKAAIVSMEDLQKLKKIGHGEQTRLQDWMKETRALAYDILEKRGGRWIDVDELLAAGRVEREERSDWIASRD